MQEPTRQALTDHKLASSTCPPSARSRSPVTSGRTPPLLTVGVQAKVHLDRGGGATARKAPVRIAECGIRIVGEIQPPVLLWNAGQRQADDSLTRLLIERGSREDNFTVAIMSPPALAEHHDRLFLPFLYGDLPALGGRGQARAGRQPELQVERHEAVREVGRTDQFVPCPPGEGRCDNQNGGGKGARNARRLPGCGVRFVCIRRRRTFADEANLAEQPYTGAEAYETADRPDIEEGTHGDAAISVRTREADHQKRKPEPAGERAEKTRQDAEDEAHEREVRGYARVGTSAVSLGAQANRCRQRQLVRGRH